MSPGAYPELFFLDEVAALAAGHRAYAERRRARYNEFRDAWSSANQPGISSRIRVPQMDKVMHKERIENGQKVTWCGQLAELPHGAMFQLGDASYAICDEKILKWSSDGYTTVERKALPETVDVLTPRYVVNGFAGGIRPDFHPSAQV